MIAAFDFDGVLYDGVNECLLVAWNTFYKKSAFDFNEQTRKHIHNNFKKIFLECRNYVRHDGHFIVPFYMKTEQDINFETFTDVYNKIPEKIKDDFRKRFILYREEVRALYPKLWINLHTELLNLNEIIGLGIDIRITSGKDKESIEFILNAKGINIPSAKIIGRMSHKNETLLKLKKEAAALNGRFIFIDDNLNNIIDAQSIGVVSLWAGWGYQTNAQKSHALSMSVNSISKPELIEKLANITKRERNEKN